MPPNPQILVFYLINLPSFEIDAMDGKAISTGAVDAFVCVVSGTVGGLIIGLVTEYYTSFSYAPVREVSGKKEESTPFRPGFFFVFLLFCCFAVLFFTSQSFIRPCFLFFSLRSVWLHKSEFSFGLVVF